MINDNNIINRFNEIYNLVFSGDLDRAEIK